MMVACGRIGLQLVAYATKPWLVGRDGFGGTVMQYWYPFMSVLLVTTGFAMPTKGLGAINMGVGIGSLRYRPKVGAMVGAISPHCLNETFYRSIWSMGCCVIGSQRIEK